MLVSSYKTRIIHRVYKWLRRPISTGYCRGRFESRTKILNVSGAITCLSTSASSFLPAAACGGWRVVGPSSSAGIRAVDAAVAVAAADDGVVGAGSGGSVAVVWPCTAIAALSRHIAHRAAAAAAVDAPRFRRAHIAALRRRGCDVVVVVVDGRSPMSSRCPRR